MGWGGKGVTIEVHGGDRPTDQGCAELVSTGQDMIYQKGLTNLLLQPASIRCLLCIGPGYWGQGGD
jgi:hypothetical protein